MGASPSFHAFEFSLWVFTLVFSVRRDRLHSGLPVEATRSSSRYVPVCRVMLFKPCASEVVQCLFFSLTFCSVTCNHPSEESALQESSDRRSTRCELAALTLIIALAEVALQSRFCPQRKGHLDTRGTDRFLSVAAVFVFLRFPKSGSCTCIHYFL